MPQAGPWTKYQTQTAPVEAGPWTKYAQPQQSAAPPSAPAAPKQPQSTLDTFLQFSGLSGMKEALTGGLLRAGQTAHGLTANERANTSTLGVKPIAGEPRSPATGPEKAGAGLEQLLELLIPAGPPAAKALESIPSSTRAAAKLDLVMSKAKDIPLGLGEADDIALRALELGGKGATPGRGSQLPKVVKDFIKQREMSPEMTFEMGRDIGTAAGALSKREVTRLNGPMQGQVKAFAAAVKAANREAAEKVGMGALYDAAIKEYRQAKKLEDFGKALQKAGKGAGKAALYGAAGGTAGKIAWDIFNR